MVESPWYIQFPDSGQLATASNPRAEMCSDDLILIGRDVALAP